MANMCVVGLQWGDEGKGKIIDILARSFDVVARYQGGSNAGHTVVIGKDKFVLHLIPSGILHDGKTCVIGNGVAVDPGLLLQEIDELRARGVKVSNNLFISDRAHVVLPYHKTLDQLSDQAKREGKKIGSTGRGIGPCYTDKMSRCGIRVAELYDPDLFREKLRDNLERNNGLIAAQSAKGAPAETLSLEAVQKQYLDFAERLRPLVCDTVELMAEFIRSGKRILFEGAQGSLLDVDFGTYPFITSSNATACGVATGLGVPPKHVGHILGVMKAYTTRVGGGPFPTELHEGVGERLRTRGGEYGATTGRPRRCGWFDAVAARYATLVNGVDTIALTKLDVLGGEERIKVCVGYKIDGQVTRRFPANTALLDRVQPVYEEFEGWGEDLSGITRFSDLPRAAQAYVRVIEDVIGLRIEMVSVGKERTQVIRL
jgi:adenylosuccinate synthase